MDVKQLPVIGLLVLLLISSSQGQDDRCHRHCNCTVPTDVTCANVNAIPAPLPGAVVYLTLSNNFIGPILLKIQVDQLASLPLRELYLSNSRIEAVEETAFSELTQLQVLDISNNRIKAFTENIFAGLTNLRYLFANNAGLENINNRAFDSIPNILEIDLEDNRLREIRGEFESLTNLKELLLAQNQISQIFPGAFSGLSELNHLSLFNNKLLQPLDSWFRTLVANNGLIEVDYRFNSSIRQPNDWLCCPDVALYYNFIRRLNRSLISYPQLDVTCTWPLALSGRPISTLTMEELNTSPCLEYFATTTFANSPDEGAGTVTVDDAVNPDDGNFLRNLSDAGAFFILLLFVVIGGCLVVGFSYWYKNKQGRQRLISLKNNLLKNKTDTKNSHELTRKPYRQETTSYGTTNEAKRPLGPPPPRPARPVRPAPVSPPSGVTRGRPIFSMDTDYSEEEIWSKT